MSKGTLSSAFNSAWHQVTKHSPEILTGIGIAGMLTTTVLAVAATPKALRLIESEKKRINDSIPNKKHKVTRLTALETVKVAWKPYVPAAITGVASVACLIGASSVHLKRNAALATAYKLSETALTDYRKKTIEMVGEKKEQIIQENTRQERIDRNPVSKNEVIVTGGGETLCYDSISCRYFKSDIDKINKAVNNLNRDMICDTFGYVSLNDFYDELGIPRSSMGDELGWRVDRGLIEIGFSSHITDEGKPCVVIDYRVEPRYDYSKFA